MFLLHLVRHARPEQPKKKPSISGIQVIGFRDTGLGQGPSYTGVLQYSTDGFLLESRSHVRRPWELLRSTTQWAKRLFTGHDPHCVVDTNVRICVQKRDQVLRKKWLNVHVLEMPLIAYARHRSSRSLRCLASRHVLISKFATTTWFNVVGKDWCEMVIPATDVRRPELETIIRHTR